MGDIRAHDLALGHLNARGFIQFHPLLAQRLDSFKAAIFLGHALYWSRYLAHAQPHRRGWFFMTATQWREATGLSTHEQIAVRNDLTSRGLMEEALAGRPAVLHYRVNLEATAALLGVENLTWETLKELLRSSISFYKPLSDICGSVSAGLYLSYLLQRQSYALRNPVSDNRAVDLFPGEFSYRPEQARIALCLGIKAQRNAREKLRASGFIREGRANHEVVATRVNLAAIASCLQAQDKPARKQKTRQQPVPLVLTPTPQPASRARAKQNPTTGTAAPIGGLSRTSLPQRQLPLFAPMGLAAASGPGAEDAGHEAAPFSDAARLVKSLFAPGLMVPEVSSQEAAPITTHSGPHGQRMQAAGSADAAARLSTGRLAGDGEFALFESPIRPFLEPNLPFFKNYIRDQRFNNLPTTTTPTPSAVDNSASETPGRRGLKNQVDQKTPAGEWSGGHGVEKTLREPGFDSISVEADWSANLVLPSQLDASVHGAVLATVATVAAELRQTFLDELAGHLSIPGKVIHNAAGWLHGLIRRHRDGMAVLAMAPQVAALRTRRQRHQERLEAPEPADATRQSQQTSAAAPDMGPAGFAGASESHTQKEQRQRLLALRNELAAKSGGVS